MWTELKFAIVYVVAAFVWSYFEYLSGLQSSRIALHPYFVTPFYVLLTGVIYYFASREKRVRAGGKIGFGQILLSGLLLTLLILVLNLIPFYIFNTFVNPDFFAALARQAVDNGDMTVAAANEYYSFRNLLIQGSIYRAVMGIAASLLMALVMRRG
jgi:hypothetical protein